MVLGFYREARLACNRTLSMPITTVPWDATRSSNQSLPVDTSYTPIKRAAWKTVTDDANEGLWDRFESKFGWDRSAGITSPVIRDPEPSITFDLSSIPDGPGRVAARASIEAEAFAAFFLRSPRSQLWWYSTGSMRHTSWCRRSRSSTMPQRIRSTVTRRFTRMATTTRFSPLTSQKGRSATHGNPRSASSGAASLTLLDAPLRRGCRSREPLTRRPRGMPA